MVGGDDFLKYAMGVGAILAPLLSAGTWVSSCILGKRNLRSSQLNSKKLDSSHDQVNARMDELISMNRKDATSIEKQRGIDEHEAGG